MEDNLENLEDNENLEYNENLEDNINLNELENLQLDEYGIPLEEENEEEMLEIRRIVSEKTVSLDYNFENSCKTKNKIKNNNSKKKLSLNDLQNIMNTECENQKPKKFISKRTNDKKKIDVVVNIQKRKFNPRLPPYLESEEYYNKINKTI